MVLARSFRPSRSRVTSSVEDSRAGSVVMVDASHACSPRRACPHRVAHRHTSAAYDHSPSTCNGHVTEMVRHRCNRPSNAKRSRSLASGRVEALARELRSGLENPLSKVALEVAVGVEPERLEPGPLRLLRGTPEQ